MRRRKVCPRSSVRRKGPAHVCHRPCDTPLFPAPPTIPRQGNCFRRWRVLWLRPSRQVFPDEKRLRVWVTVLLVLFANSLRGSQGPTTPSSKRAQRGNQNLFFS